MSILTRVLLALFALGCAIHPSGVAWASGAYSCCFIDKAGKQYTYRSRASSFYKGSIERLCRAVAIDEEVKPCNPAVTDMAADLDFTKSAMPATYDLSRSCKKYPCTIGILLAGPADVADEKGHFEVMVSNAGLTCSIEQQIYSTTDGWTLSIAAPKLEGKTVKPSAGCTVVRLKNGKDEGRVSFEYGPVKP